MSDFQKTMQAIPEIFIIEDDPIFTRLFEKNLQKTFDKFQQKFDLCCFTNDCKPPALFILDILLTGPDGFTFLNEIASYPDLSSIPVIIVSSLNFPDRSFESYNIVKILNKTTMMPTDLTNSVIEILNLKAT